MEMVMTGSEEVRILLVDDDQTLLEYLSKRLQRDGFSVRATFSGEEALEVVIQEDFDVAVVDLKMPGIDGVETQKRLKEVLPLLQCVVLTGYGSIETALKSGQQGAYDYLFKPIDYESLVEAIRGAWNHKRELEREQAERMEQAASSFGSSGGGVKKIWDNLRRVFGVPRQ
jgi:two-component system NtrC family response regulator